MEVQQMQKAETISAAELATFVRFMREYKKWSQDTLAEISKLSIRTIQRIENGKPSNEDTRRALALALSWGMPNSSMSRLFPPIPNRLRQRWNV